MTKREQQRLDRALGALRSYRMRERIRGRRHVGHDARGAAFRLDDAVGARDARELRGEPVDWTRPVEGWLLW